MVQLTPKDSYGELTDLQRAIVDRYVETRGDPDVQQKDIAEELDTSAEHVSRVLNAYENIVDAEIERRQRAPQPRASSGGAQPPSDPSRGGRGAPVAGSEAERPFECAPCGRRFETFEQAQGHIYGKRDETHDVDPTLAGMIIDHRTEDSADLRYEGEEQTTIDRMDDVLGGEPRRAQTIQERPVKHPPQAQARTQAQTRDTPAQDAQAQAQTRAQGEPAQSADRTRGGGGGAGGGRDEDRVQINLSVPAVHRLLIEGRVDEEIRREIIAELLREVDDETTRAIITALLGESGGQETDTDGGVGAVDHLVDAATGGSS